MVAIQLDDGYVEEILEKAEGLLARGDAELAGLTLDFAARGVDELASEAQAERLQALRELLGRGAQASGPGLGR